MYKHYGNSLSLTTGPALSDGTLPVHVEVHEYYEENHDGLQHESKRWLFLLDPAEWCGDLTEFAGKALGQAAIGVWAKQRESE